MAGNVAEWCQDTYHPNYDGAPDDGLVWLGGKQRVVRGGSIRTTAAECRAASRIGVDPEQASSDIGFRLVRDTVTAKK